jgi:hypothetical protein
MDFSFVKSLNLTSRMKELERIDKENFKMINALIKTKPEI